jgi:Txe/YoeB family toxin of Txe-Axe toxin-antitoxin module
MAFTEIELKQIENVVGKMCKRRSPEQFHDELRLVYEVRGHDVIVCEERPRWDDPKQLSSLPVAKFKYTRKDSDWKLYWMRRDLKWHLYEMPKSTKTIEALVKEVDKDPHGAFFG